MGYSSNVGGAGSDCNNVGGYGGSKFGSGFALLVVLFILLIIVGAAFFNNGGYGGYNGNGYY